MTLNIGEKPRKLISIQLNNILDEHTESKYSISSKTCKIILNRALRKEKEFPSTLKFALENQIDENNKSSTINTTVRRLSPKEYERLQGYPDEWTGIGDWINSKGKKRKQSDSSRYKALGNSVALPFWQWLAKRICNKYDRQITIGSLFDGISGFPFVFAQIGAKPLWSSEIEEFPIAVCKKRFGDEDTGEVGNFNLFNKKNNINKMKKIYKIFRKTAHPRNKDEGQGWEEAIVADTLNIYDTGEIRTPILIVEINKKENNI